MQKIVVAKKPVAKKSAVPKAKPAGTRIQFPKDAFDGLPAVKYDRDAHTATVVGLGSAGYVSPSKFKFREGKRIVSGALLIDGKASRVPAVQDVLLKHKLTPESPSSAFEKAARDLLTQYGAGGTSRWATPEETNSYVKQERALRVSLLKRVESDTRRRLRMIPGLIESAKKALSAAEKRQRTLSDRLARINALGTP